MIDKEHAIIYAILFLFACVCGLFGYFYGKKVAKFENEIEKQEAIAKQTEIKIEKENSLEFVINDKSKKYEESEKLNEISSNNLIASISSLHVNSTCRSMPTTAKNTGKSNESAGSKWDSTQQADFTDVAKQIAELGRDYDNAVERLKNLNAIIDSYYAVMGVKNN